MLRYEPYPLIHEKLVELEPNVGDGFLLKSTQEITDDFLTNLRDIRAESHRPAGDELHLAASIPTIVVDRWLREGFDVFREPVSASLARLRKEDLGAFITTNKV